MTTVVRHQFLTEMVTEGGSIDVDDMSHELRGVLGRAGVTDERLAEIAGKDGRISGKAEMKALFAVVDSYDDDDSALSIETSSRGADGQTYATASGELYDALVAEVTQRRGQPSERCEASNAATVYKQGRRPLEPGQIEVTQRAFIPDAMFMGFDGDSRGLSACLSGRARVSQYTVVDLNERRIVDNDDRSDQTRFGRFRKTADPESKAELRKLNKGALYLTQDVSASDPLVPGAPSVDMHGHYAMKLESDGVLKVWMGMSTEQFPSHEVILRDPSDQTLLVWGDNASGGAAELVGDGSPIGVAHVEIQTDDAGNFAAVRRPGGEWMTVAEWNRRAMAEAEVRR